MRRGVYAWCLIVGMASGACSDPETPGASSPLHQHETLSFSTWNGGTETAEFSVVGETDGLRSYRQSSSALQRDGDRQSVTYSEDASWPRVRSGNPAFDALFGLAVDEMKLDAVSDIRDDAYNAGQPIACRCFQTGAKWHYVWTRDLSFAAWLGLAMLDPERVRNSLEFKLSGYRSGVTRPLAAAGSADGLQVIQDTGSGGSWPVSTDRVSWAFGADATYNSLPDGERRAFAVRALQALVNTLDNDRLAAFDEETGLYTGEQSFLDWREQTYATWIPDDLASMATASAVSTNAAFYQALRLAEALADDLGQPAAAARYRQRADALKAAINGRLWLDDAGLYSSLTAGHFDKTPLHKFDWLGQALTIITGIADADKRRRILASYPHGPMGAPVIFPQQPGIPVYHNRAIWPFVTAYGLKAAKRGNNVAVADSAMELLIRAAALNLSNMENLEWLTAQAEWRDPEDPALSGPVINSRRQLWSVGAYLSLVINDVFGVDAARDGLHIAPYVTTRLRNRFLGASGAVELRNLRLRGKVIDITMELPAADDAAGVYAIASVTVNGAASDGKVAYADLQDANAVHVRLGSVVAADTDITRVTADPGRVDAAVYAPYEPVVEIARRDGKAAVTVVDTRNEGDVEYRVFRNGAEVAAGLTAGEWVDDAPVAPQSCYAAVAIFRSSGNRSHHSRPRCLDAGRDIAVDSASVRSSPAPDSAQGGAVIRDWGRPGDRFSVEQVSIGSAGRYAVQVRYVNTRHEINTGITNGVKWLTVTDADGAVAGSGVVQLPHSKRSGPPAYSTPLIVDLVPGEYRLDLTGFYNMSYLTNNSSYSYAGGSDGPVNRFDIHGVRVMPMPGGAARHRDEP